MTDKSAKFNMKSTGQINKTINTQNQEEKEQKQDNNNQNSLQEMVERIMIKMEERLEIHTNMLDKKIERMTEKFEDTNYHTWNDLLSLKQRQEETQHMYQAYIDQQQAKLEEITSHNNTTTTPARGNINFNNQDTTINTSNWNKINPDDEEKKNQKSGGDNNKQNSNTITPHTNQKTNRQIFPLTPAYDPKQDEERKKDIMNRDSVVSELLAFKATNTEKILNVRNNLHENIKWSNRSINGFLDFCKKILDWQSANKDIVPNLFDHVSFSIQRVIAVTLRIYKNEKYQAAHKRREMGIFELAEAAHIMFAPTDLKHFATLMRSSLKQYRVDQIGTNYQLTRVALHELQEKFQERYNFLVDACNFLKTPEYIPAMNFKPGGLFVLFLEFTPAGSRESFRNILVNKEFNNNLEKFFDEYLFIVEETFHMSKYANTYKHRIGEIDVQRELHFMEEYDGEMEGGESHYEDYNHGDEYDQYIRDDQSEYDALYVLDGRRNYNNDDGRGRYGGRKHDNNHHSSKSFQNNRRHEDNNGHESQICHTLLLTGECKSRSCRFSHDRKLLMIEREKTQLRWSQQSHIHNLKDSNPHNHHGERHDSRNQQHQVNRNGEERDRKKWNESKLNNIDSRDYIKHQDNNNNGKKDRHYRGHYERSQNHYDNTRNNQHLNRDSRRSDYRDREQHNHNKSYVQKSDAKKRFLRPGDAGLNYVGGSGDGNQSDDSNDNEDRESSYSSGRESDSEGYGTDSTLNVISSLLAVNSKSQYWRAANRIASVKPTDSNHATKKINTLFDSGASSDNYVTKSVLLENGWEDYMQDCRHVCTVANGERKVITKKIVLTLAFTMPRGGYIQAELDFFVFDGLPKEIIVGLPDIIRYFKNLYIQMLDLGENGKAENEKLNFIDILNKGDLPENPWSNEPRKCPEDELIQFNAAVQEIMFLEKTYSESLQEFNDELPNRVSKEFQESTNIMKYLREVAVIVFVPEEWAGILMDPVHLNVKQNLPENLKPYNVKIPPHLAPVFWKEIQRMIGYIYQASNSPIASPIVVAAKATKPFIRICGDYRRINGYLEVPKFQVPNVLEQLDKIKGFSVFVDLDLSNAFHQIPIDEASSRILSVTCPVGQFEPKFMPEGISPASLILMKTMYDIFSDLLEWMIVIHDNMLILAKDYDDAFVKTKIVIERCISRNLYLKLSKSQFGVTSVSFFGYIIENGSYRLSEERIQQVTNIPFPTSTKEVQRFLGAAMYFKTFIFNYSDKTAHLNDMVRKDFNWKEEDWKINYKKIFNDFKQDIIHSFKLYHPDFDLPWYLFVDASDIAIGGVLVQKTVDGQQQIISFVSKKFGDIAKNWSTIEKEAFAMFYSVYYLRNYLNGKHFTMLTDHHNLLWIETSNVPKIIRIRLYLQSFDFNVIHIKGSQNVFADWASRTIMNNSNTDENEEKDEKVINHIEQDKNEDKIDEILRTVHNGRMGHNGLRRTYLLLNKYHPGHNISQKAIVDFISTCTQCQKYRFGMIDSLKPPVSNLNVQHRFTCGYDLLYITPEDQEGFKYLHVIKLFPSRIVGLYPSKDLSAESLATALFQFFLTYGVTDVLITDPGSNIDSNVTKLLLSWFGIRLRMSLVNRHQSNGVERTHREILKFLSILVNHERIQNIWSKPHIIGIIQFILNSETSSETNVSPFEYIFGSVDAKYLKLPNINESIKSSSEFMNVLNQNIKMIREVADEVQEKIQKERLYYKGEERNEKLNTYKIGEHVLLNNKKMGMKKFKLDPLFSGPYIVKDVVKAKVTIEHIVTGIVKQVHMENLKPHYGNNYDEAYKAALVDQDQFIIKSINGYSGDPEKRSSMSFRITFDDNETKWIPFSTDISSTEQFKEYCKLNKPLIPLLYSEKEWKLLASKMDKIPITTVKPKQICYVNLKCWGWNYYQNLNLPEFLEKSYFIKCNYGVYSKGDTRIDLHCKLFKQIYTWKNSDVERYGLIFQLSDGMVEVTKEFCKLYPAILD